MPSIPPESCHHRVEKSLPETSFEVVLPYKTEEEANYTRSILLGTGLERFERAEVREVAK